MEVGNNLIKVLTRRQAIAEVGVSEKTWERLEALADVPTKTRLSQGRVGYRLLDIKEWLDARREADTWKSIGEAARAVVAKVRP